MWSGIRIWISGLIRIYIQISARFLQKCCGFNSLVSMNHFAKYRKNRPVTVWEMLTNCQKSLFCNGEENEKVIWNPQVDPDQCQKLTTSRGSSLVHVYHVWSTSASAFVSYPAHRQTDRHTERTITLFHQLGEVINGKHYLVLLPQLCHHFPWNVAGPDWSSCCQTQQPCPTNHGHPSQTEHR